MESELHRLNDQYAINEHVLFKYGVNGLITAVIENRFAKAAITLAGAQVMSFTPHGEPPLLWESPSTGGTIGEVMRGGVPVCWPWFADHPTQPKAMPIHGFVRTMLWHPGGTRACPDGSTWLRLLVRDTPETLVHWPHAFELEVDITVGRKLRVEWIASNPGVLPYTYTGALHPYYAVQDIHAINICGLEQSDYLDATDEFRRKTQTGPLRITEETDRIYLDTIAKVAIEDLELGRSIRIAKEGSRTTVVWNPDDQDALMPDVGAGQHHRFVCVEAANAGEELVTVEPGGEGHLAIETWSERGANP